MILDSVWGHGCKMILKGLEALREHFKNSKFPKDAEEYMPVVFMPPRDGQRLTEPVPIIVHAAGEPATAPPSTPTTSLSSSKHDELEAPSTGWNGYGSSDKDEDVGSSGSDRGGEQ